MANIEILNPNDYIIHFGLDHLEVYWTFKYESEYFDMFDFDNSNYWELNEYKFTKNEVPKYKYKIIFTKGDYSLFAYYKWRPKDDKQPVWTRDYIVVYSTAFRLMEYEEIAYFLEYYFKLNHCRRFDICIDLKMDIDTILSDFNEYKTWREYKKSWFIETKYIWEVKDSLNKRQLIRVYNKKKDILVKRKTKLYEDYLNLDNVTRIELEVRQELAKNKYYQDLFDDNLLIWIFKNYLYKHTKIFDCIDWERITLYRKIIKPSKELSQTLFYKNYRKSVFVWHAKTIFEMWFCPVKILIWEQLIQPTTKKILFEEIVDSIEENERKLKSEIIGKICRRKNKKWLSSNEGNYG